MLPASCGDEPSLLTCIFDDRKEEGTDDVPMMPCLNVNLYEKHRPIDTAKEVGALLPVS